MTVREPLRLGRSEVRFDARAKAAGTEPYAADLYPPNLLWAGAVRAGIASGWLRSVATEAALAVPGVRKVLTAADVPGPNRHGIIHRDTPVLVDDAAERNAKLALASAARQVLANGLGLLGVSAPEKM